MSNKYCPLKDIIIKEIRYDNLTPIMAYKAIATTGCCMFESAHDEGYGTYSYIGVNPLATFTANNRDVVIEVGSEVTQLNNVDPYSILEEFIASRKAFGFMGYNVVRLKENIPNRHSPQATPDFLFHLYKTVIKFDHLSHKIVFSHEGTHEELDQLIEDIFKPVEIVPFAEPRPLDLHSNVTDEEFMHMVKQAQEYIKAGDIFQVVLSRTFMTNITSSALDIYRALRQLNPTPYLAFFEEKDYAIASASPELLVGVKDGVIETIPIAGTCKKGDDINKLLNDPKETAEHIMLVDLARNDVGSVSNPGTVSVSVFKAIKSYSHVTHIVSRVIGKLNTKFKPLNVVKALLPAGTLSGAPKIRAMEIIDELEYSSRGLYGGSMMLIDEVGNITSSIAIRTAVIYDNKVEVRTGAGIVLDSVPEKEVEETKLKARGVWASLELANGSQK